MKKIIFVICVLVVVLTGCKRNDDKTITVGASSVPHAEILEAARSQVEAQGYKLDIQVFDDYTLPNKALDNGDLDANYFQHEPFLEDQEQEFGYKFNAVANIHVEPIRIYSKKYNSVDEIKKGSTILISNSISDQARILSLLAENDLITLKQGVDSKYATLDDIKSNPLELKFKTDYDPSILAKVYENNEGDLVAINTNYALTAGIDQSEALISESDDSDYANCLVVRDEDKNSEKTKVLVKALTSDETKKFINEEYDGAVIPAKN